MESKLVECWEMPLAELSANFWETQWELLLVDQLGPLLERNSVDELDRTTVYCSVVLLVAYWESDLVFEWVVMMAFEWVALMVFGEAFLLVDWTVLIQAVERVE